MIKKAFIYDTSKGFSAFIKHYYSGTMEIDSCTKKAKFKNYKMTDYEVCFFTINDIDDYIALRKFYCETETFFISSARKIFLDKIKTLNYDNAIFIDFNDRKKNIISKINSNLVLMK